MGDVKYLGLSLLGFGLALDVFHLELMAGGLFLGAYLASVLHGD